jgi:sulfur carrier protein ThiS adenylyltransferase
MKIGIAGCGGIGSNVAVNLVRSGVKQIKMVDFDRVDASNLNRQFYFKDQIGRPKVEMLAVNLKRIDPGLMVEALPLRLDAANIPSTFADCDLVVEGFDGQAQKKLLLEALADTDKIVVSASGIAGHCMNGIKVRQMGNCVVVGDFVTDCRHAGLYAPKVTAVAAMMADIVLEKGNYYDG